MGNSESKEGGGQQQATSPKNPSQLRYGDRRGEHKTAAGAGDKSSSSHPLPLSHVSRAKATPPPPTSTLLSTGQAITSTSNAHAHATTIPVSASPRHSRNRSSTSSAAAPLKPQLSGSQRSEISAMGNAESKPGHRPPSRSNTLPPSSPPARSTPPSSIPESQQPASPGPVKPVDVPISSITNDGDDYIPGYSESPYGLPVNNYSRPPRLPLPIEEEDHAPGSPIITPQDITSPLGQSDIEGGAIPRKSSVLSSTTLDDEELGDNEAFVQDSDSKLHVRVPTRLEWHGEGEQLFVTGTFCNWEKKIKLPRIKDGKGGFGATIHLPPGTHHIKYLVDGEMITSPELPTTVDWGNILVNYIEVVAPLPPVIDDGKQAPAPAEPIPIPGAAATAGQPGGTADEAAKTLSLRPHPETSDRVSDLPQTDGGKSQPDPATASVPIPATPTPKQAGKDKGKGGSKQKAPRPRYTTEVPQYLIDLDNYHNPEDERFQRAQSVSGTLPSPPTLPMFLSKSILNGTTPHKDDASVLIMPNHTVLNHLATSSIRSGVLATSGTTRYKRKVR